MDQQKKQDRKKKTGWIRRVEHDGKRRETRWKEGETGRTIRNRMHKKGKQEG